MISHTFKTTKTNYIFYKYGLFILALMMLNGALWVGESKTKGSDEAQYTIAIVVYIIFSSTNLLTWKLEKKFVVDRDTLEFMSFFGRKTTLPNPASSSKIEGYLKFQGRKLVVLNDKNSSTTLYKISKDQMDILFPDDVYHPPKSPLVINKPSVSRSFIFFIYGILFACLLLTSYHALLGATPNTIWGSAIGMLICFSFITWFGFYDVNKMIFSKKSIIIEPVFGKKKIFKINLLDDMQIEVTYFYKQNINNIITFHIIDRRDPNAIKENEKLYPASGMDAKNLIEIAGLEVTSRSEHRNPDIIVECLRNVLGK